MPTDRLKGQVKKFVKLVRDDDRPHVGMRLHDELDLFGKAKPEVLQPGQIWLAKPKFDSPDNDYAFLNQVRSVGMNQLEMEAAAYQWKARNKNIAALFILDTIRGQGMEAFLLVAGYPFLADEHDLVLNDSPIGQAFVATWRGRVSLSHNHLRTYFGDVTESQLQEIRNRAARFNYVTATGACLPPKSSNPILQPFRDIMWASTTCYDQETRQEQ